MPNTIDTIGHHHGGAGRRRSAARHRGAAHLRGLALGAVAALAVSACGSAAPSAAKTSSSSSTSATPSSSASTSTAKPAHPKLVYFIFTGYTYPYFAPMAKAVKQAAAHYPALDIKILSAHNSASTEISDIKEAVAAGAKGIILNTVAESVTGAAKAALAQGIPIITIDRDVSTPSARTAFIGDNDVVLGKDQTTYALKYLAAHHVPKPWHVVVLQGTLGASVSIGRLDGAMSVLKPYIANGSVKVVLNQSANFHTGTAQTMVSEELAKTRNIQLIVAANDAMALGAITALSSHGVTPGKKTFVVGADAQPQSLTAVKKGTQLDTVTHSPFVEAYWAVEAMDNKLIYHITPPKSKFPHASLLIPMQLVTKANVSQVSGWGTPKVIPPLPYGHSKAYPVASSS